MVKTYESIREKAATRVQPVHAFPTAFRPSEVVETLKGDAFIYAALRKLLGQGLGLLASLASCFAVSSQVPFSGTFTPALEELCGSDSAHQLLEQVSQELPSDMRCRDGEPVSRRTSGPWALQQGSRPASGFSSTRCPGIACQVTAIVVPDVDRRTFEAVVTRLSQLA